MNVFSRGEFDLKKSKNCFIFICDHASNYIPKKFKNLGLSDNFLRSHIAWDIGAKNFTVKLTKEMNQCFFYCNFSRLIIDPNRTFESKDLIVSKSDEILIPGNTSLKPKEIKFRINKFYIPYHKSLNEFINLKKKKKKKIFLVAIHSFTKKMNNSNRAVEIGLLSGKNMELLLKIQKKLSKKKIHFGRNYPYSGFFYNSTLDRHSKDGLISNISIEIRNDLICNKKGINKYVNIFRNILEDI